LTIASMSARLACVRSEDSLGSESEASFSNRAGAYPEYVAGTAANESMAAWMIEIHRSRRSLSASFPPCTAAWCCLCSGMLLADFGR
jgi:hypothetical protein